MSRLLSRQNNDVPESVIQGISEWSGGSGVVIRHKSDSLNFSSIFEQTISERWSDIELDESTYMFCYKLANRLNLLGLSTDKAIELAVLNRNIKSKNVDVVALKIAKSNMPVSESMSVPQYHRGKLPKYKGPRHLRKQPRSRIGERVSTALRLRKMRRTAGGAGFRAKPTKSLNSFVIDKVKSFL